jgi:SM-20-related protein
MRVQIRDLLTADSAAQLFQELRQETRWTTTFSKGAQHCEIANLPAEKRRRLATGAVRDGDESVRYVHDRHVLARGRESYPDPAHYYAELVEFLNAPPFLDLVREVTGLGRIAWADARASLYRPGDFLHPHDDARAAPRPLAAYVLNLTPDWSADWGGELRFYDALGNFAEAYVPEFNVLTLFRVPARHAVTPVSPLGRERYSVVGWFYAD